jgi:alpha-L-fucosidase
VGRGTTFLLNLAPDRRGLIPDVDRQSLRGFRSHLDKTARLLVVKSKHVFAGIFELGLLD